jgi:LPXTG-motif cell wall-anchored protein
MRVTRSLLALSACTAVSAVLVLGVTPPVVADTTVDNGVDCSTEFTGVGASLGWGVLVTAPQDADGLSTTAFAPEFPGQPVDIGVYPWDPGASTAGAAIAGPIAPDNLLDSGLWVSTATLTAPIRAGQQYVVGGRGPRFCGGTSATMPTMYGLVAWYVYGLPTMFGGSVVFHTAPTLPASVPSAPGESSVTIAGSELDAIVGATLDGAPVAFTLVSPSELSVTLPTLAAGAHALVLTSRGGADYTVSLERGLPATGSTPGGALALAGALLAAGVVLRRVRAPQPAR